MNALPSPDTLRAAAVHPHAATLAEIAALVVAPGLTTTNDMLNRLLAIHDKAQRALSEPA